MGIAVVQGLVSSSFVEYCAQLPNGNEFAASPEALAAQCRLVQMEDDAMAAAGMPRGSSALVMTEREFSSGDIVFAHTPHGELIRRFVAQDHPPYISVLPDPEDTAYPTIAFGPDSELLGRVIGVMHSNGSVHAITNVNR